MLSCQTILERVRFADWGIHSSVYGFSYDQQYQSLGAFSSTGLFFHCFIYVFICIGVFLPSSSVARCRKAVDSSVRVPISPLLPVVGAFRADARVATYASQACFKF